MPPGHAGPTPRGGRRTKAGAAAPGRAAPLTWRCDRRNHRSRRAARGGGGRHGAGAGHAGLCSFPAALALWGVREKWGEHTPKLCLAAGAGLATARESLRSAVLCASGWFSARTGAGVVGFGQGVAAPCGLPAAQGRPGGAQGRGRRQGMLSHRPVSPGSVGGGSVRLSAACAPGPTRGRGHAQSPRPRAQPGPGPNPARACPESGDPHEGTRGRVPGTA